MIYLPSNASRILMLLFHLIFYAFSAIIIIKFGQLYSGILFVLLSTLSLIRQYFVSLIISGSTLIIKKIASKTEIRIFAIKRIEVASYFENTMLLNIIFSNDNGEEIKKSFFRLKNMNQFVQDIKNINGAIDIDI